MAVQERMEWEGARMRVAIVGAGGLGLFYGGMLARGGIPVTYLTRGANLGLLRERGVTVTRLDTGERFTARVDATDDAASVGPVECAIVCVKLYDLDEAAIQMAPLVGAETVVIPVQNGIDAPERLGARLGLGRVVGGVAGLSSTRTAPGHTTSSFAPAALTFGELGGGPSARTARLREAFVAAGLPTVVSDEIGVALWRKFVTVCVATISAVARLPLGMLLGRAAPFALAQGLEAEIRALAVASGVVLPPGLAEGICAAMTRDAASARAYPSQYHDLVAGRRLEIEYLNGAVVRLGRALGVPTPLNFALYTALEAHANGQPALP